MWLRFKCNSQLISLVKYLYSQTKNNYNIILVDKNLQQRNLENANVDNCISCTIVSWSGQTAALKQISLGAKSVTHGTKGSRSDCRMKDQILMSHFILVSPFSVKVIMRHFPKKDQEDSQESEVDGDQDI